MSFTAKSVAVTVVAAAICGLGATAAAAATPRVADTQGYFGIELANNTASPLKIYTYQGNDWDYSDVPANPTVGTIIPQGQQMFLYLYNHAGAVDAVGISPTAFNGNLGMGIKQDNWGDSTEWDVGGSTLHMDVQGSGDGYAIVSITNPSA